ncbi:dedicator of cytokinesis protein 3 [Elysia marginata]|uniref:Dedicator of cytokinesis protein 3 n=1 Tax=Elysia marginata TaxID=1093978 RepID=A0AAV4IM76_9GAST|nr:dedicator of cytokinesis protein 3 [Elysia marginata]
MCHQQQEQEGHLPGQLHTQEGVYSGECWVSSHTIILVVFAGPYETVTPVEDAIIKELTYVLREWNEQWKALFVKRKSLFKTIMLVMGELDKCRSKLVSNTLTKEQALALKHQVVTMIDWGNGQLGMDLVPRVRYRQADPDKVSVVEMFRIHERSVMNCQGAWVSPQCLGAWVSPHCLGAWVSP